MSFRPVSENSGFTFPAGTFDVRGWAVRTMVDGEKAGEVDDLLIDEGGVVRYLDVALGMLEKHVLVPVAQARVDEAEDTVWVPGMTKQQLREVPAYEHDVGGMSRDYEDRVRAVYAGARTDAGVRLGEERRAAVRRSESAVGELASLGELEDYRIAAGDPDPRGWEVIASDGRVIGTVHELIVDTAAMKVRYLDCDVDAEALRIEAAEHHVLIPIGYARLDEDEERVIVDAITSSEAAGLPAYRGAGVTPEHEETLHARFTGGAGGGGGAPRGQESGPDRPRTGG